MKKSVCIGLLGLGTVGQGLVKSMQLLSEKIVKDLHTTIKIKKALVRDLSKKREIQEVALTMDPNEMLHDPEIDILVEVMGSEHPTYSYVKEALYVGKHIVTANKLLMAIHGQELRELAQRQGLHLLYEASVLGGVPILRTIKSGLAGDQVDEISGILNGTTNYILTQMTRLGKEYQEALVEAQREGYAENDPTMDVSGIDAACKLVILCRDCFGINVKLEEVAISGIQNISAKEIEAQKLLGLTPKLVARATRDQSLVQAKVGIEWLSEEEGLSQISGVDNGLSLKTALRGELFWRGPGAGGLATGGAVLSDVMEVASLLVKEDNMEIVAR